MGGVDLYCGSQRVPGPLETGFQNVMGVLPRQLDEMDRGGHIPGKAQPEFRGALHIEIADLFGLAVDVPVQGAPARKVHGAEHQCLIHGQVEAAVAADASHLAQRLGKGLAQRNAESSAVWW